MLLLRGEYLRRHHESTYPAHAVCLDSSLKERRSRKDGFLSRNVELPEAF